MLPAWPNSLFDSELASPHGARPWCQCAVSLTSRHCPDHPGLILGMNNSLARTPQLPLCEASPFPK
eukprot:1157965-Pelagomonas_calceolata.AAC.10